MKNSRKITAETYIMPFGKYKGQTLDSVGKSDPYYVKWCCLNIEWFGQLVGETRSLWNWYTKTCTPVFKYAWEHGIDHDRPSRRHISIFDSTRPDDDGYDIEGLDGFEF